MDKAKFTQECHRQLLEHFTLVKIQKVDEAMKHRIQGFINAGEFLNLVTRDEAIGIIDAAHHEIFGITKEQRKARKEKIKNSIKGDDFSVFDAPAIERLDNY
jgi:hypothetical protein